MPIAAQRQGFLADRKTHQPEACQNLNPGRIKSWRPLITPGMLVGLRALGHWQPQDQGMCYDICLGLEDTQMKQAERHVRLFRNGRNQALRIPREFELEGNEAIIRKEGDRLIVEPVRKGRLLALLATLDPLEETFPDTNEDLAPLDDVTI